MKKEEFIVYRRDVCRIEKINPKFHNNTDYFEVVPVNDESLKLKVPANSPDLRKLISKKQAEKIIDSIPTIPAIEVNKNNEKVLENEYKKLLKSGNHEDLIIIIKTTYARNKNRLEQNKKIGDKDNTYFELAEKYLYTELSLVLNKDLKTTKQYVVDRVTYLENK